MKVAAQKSSGSGGSLRRRRAPIRILTAVPICDGHDSPIITVNFELVQHAIEVIYLGYHRSVRDIVRAAIQENVRAVGISSYNGGHVEFFAEGVQALKKEGAENIAVFGGGGGTISADDVREMEKRGVEKIFPAGTPLNALVTYVKTNYSRERKPRTSPKNGSDRYLAKLVSGEIPAPKSGRDGHAPLTIGITGPGGAGK